MAAGTAAGPKPPPGPNVHLVRESGGRSFWRGGAPREETLRALAASAQERNVPVTLFDLRHPANQDDRSGKDRRLSPEREAALARKLGLRYLSISALDRSLPQKLRASLAEGDVYMHCMYGVNRTGFAAARYGRAAGQKLDRKGLGPHDWEQGDRYQARLEKPAR